MSKVMIVGVGGQGTLLASRIIGNVAIKQGYDVKVSEVHGMSQRGGDVQSNLRLSSDPISSDLIPTGGVDIIISLEPMEALRYVGSLSKEGWIVTSTIPFINIPNYPDTEEVIKHIKAIPNNVMLDVETLAKNAGAPAQASNMVLLGAAVPMLGIEYDAIKEAVRKIFSRKGEDIVNSNLAALDAGYQYSIESTK